MNNIYDGGPAFPSHGSMGEVAHDGMTLRDYFAAKDLGKDDGGNSMSYEKLADHCYRMADAMLAARSKS